MRLSGGSLTTSGKSSYSIKPGYCHATTAEVFDDRGNTDEWQKEVYELAQQMMSQNKWLSVVDVGCGSGYKLIHQLGSYETIGIEIEPAFSFLEKTYPDRQWLKFQDVLPASIQCDLVISSDVIEHLANPDELMIFLSQFNAKHFIISTPERDLVEGTRDFGPPANPTHFREWNKNEFSTYVSSWFMVNVHHIFPGKSVTQVVICQKY